MVAVRQATETVNLGELGDSLYAKNEEIAKKNGELKTLELEKKDIEAKLLDGLNAAGTDIARGERATVSLSETVRAQISDPEKFNAYVLRTKALHLFERRISSTAYAEQKSLNRGKPIPGLTDFVQTRINCRKV